MKVQNLNKAIQVRFHQDGQGMDIDFLNGSVSVPNEYGGYAISCGCGGGKTTAIKDIIMEKANEGVVYLVDTVKELEKMFNDLKKLIKMHPEKGITEKDIFCIRSRRREKDGQDDEFNQQLAAFKNDVGILRTKKILLLTHVRFFSSLTPEFLLFSNQAKVDEFDGDFQHLMKSECIRKYILIDETPNQWASVVKIPRLLLHAMTDESIDGAPRKFKENLKDIYDEFCEDSEYDIIKGFKQFREQRKDAVLKSIPYLLKDWEKTNLKTFPMYFLPSQLIQRDMKCHVLIFEGVGDVLLKDSKRFKLIKTDQRRYSATVDCETFEFGLDRKRKFDENTMNGYMDRIRPVLAKTAGSTLLVCWKDINGMKDERTGSSLFAESLQEAIDKEFQNVKVIYHGSSQTKSTNDFRTYRNIIFLGDWSIGNEDMRITQMAYDIPLTIDRWKFYYYVQCICRIGIRNHNGGNYHVFFSDDHDVGFMEMVRRYFNENADYVKPQKKDEPLLRILKGLDERFRKSAMNLARYDPEVEKAILENRKKEIIIPIEDMARIQNDRKEKKAKPSRYRKFCRVMEKLGITLCFRDRRGIVKTWKGIRKDKVELPF